MAMLNQDELIAVRQSVNIVDIISSYIPLEHKGKNYFGVCPFHADHSPSMSVSEEKQIYKCFSCGAAGNVFTFIQNYENISFGEAVNTVARIAGITLSSNIKNIKSDKNSKYYEIMDVAGKYFINNLKTEYGKEANEYLKRRNLNKDIINEFGIGLSLPQKDILYKILKSKNIEDKDIELLGLKTDNNHDTFINRIMFPLHDINGHIIGFSGRLYTDVEGPKYLNTKETIIFKKGQMLFNYHRAKNAIKIEKSVILVEGYMDAIRLYSNGIKNVIAIMGTSLTKDQINLIRKLHAKIILCLDNDIPGEKATYEIGNILKQENFDVEVIRLSDQKDPDEYVISQGIDAFQKNLKNPLKFLEFSMNYLKNNKNLNNSVDLASYINDVLKDISSSNDEILIDITLKQISNDYNIEYEILKDKLNKIKKIEKEVKNSVKIDVLPSKSVKKGQKSEKNIKNLIFFMMNDEKYVRIYQSNLIFMNDLKYREIVKEILYYYDLHNNINVADFLVFAINNEAVYQDILDIVNECSDIIMEENVFYDLLKSIKSTNEKQTIKELKSKLKNSMDKNEQVKIAMKIAEIKKGCV